MMLRPLRKAESMLSCLYKNAFSESCMVTRPPFWVSLWFKQIKFSSLRVFRPLVFLLYLVLRSTVLPLRSKTR